MASEQAFFSRGSLNEELDRFRDLCKQEWPPEAVEMVNTTLAELAHTGIHNVALKEETKRPHLPCRTKRADSCVLWSFSPEGRWC